MLPVVKSWVVFRFLVIFIRVTVRLVKMTLGTLLTLMVGSLNGTTLSGIGLMIVMLWLLSFTAVESMTEFINITRFYGTRRV